MSVKKLALLTASLAITILLGGCSSQGSSADYPKDFKVVAADNAAIVTWTAEPDVEYWLFYGPGASITTANWVVSGGIARPNSITPSVVSGLINGRTYSFTINGRKDGGPGGPGAPTLVAVPRLAGESWTVGSPLGTGKLSGVAAGVTAAGLANVTVGAGGTIYTSINAGATTTPTNPTAPSDLNAIFYSSPGFVAVGANGVALSSVDATTWTPRLSGTSATLFGVTSTTAGGYVAVGAAGTLIASVDGGTWVTASSGTTNDLYAATFGNARYVAVGAKGTIVTSADGATWQTVSSGTTQDLRGITSGFLDPTSAIPTSYFVAVGAAGTLLTSADGLAWTVRTPIAATNLAAVTYGSQFVTVGSAGSIFTSQDGVTWQPRASGTTNDLTALVRTITGYTAVGVLGTNVSSF